MEDLLKPVIAAKTIEKHLWIIIHAIVLKVSSGPAEGINSRGKTIKVHCPGFRNKQRFVNAVREFVDNYHSKFGEEPGDFAARGYAAVTILGEALDRVSMYDATSIRDGLAEIREFNSIFGSFSFDENGDAVTSLVIAQVQNNKFEVLGE